MEWLPLVLYLAFLLLAFVGRTFVHWLQTGSTGVRLPAGRSAGERAASVLFVLAIVVGLIAVVLAPLGAPFLQAEPPAFVWIVGAFAALVGLVGTVVAQGSMGASWRIGVDPAERTTLVTEGMYRLSRNPIFSFMLLFGAGLVLMVPGIFSALSLAFLFAGVDLQVRVVEEPYLSRVHGGEYDAYRARVGRYLPHVG